MYRQRISRTSSTKPRSAPAYILRIAERNVARSRYSSAGTELPPLPRYRHGIYSMSISRYTAAVGRPMHSGTRSGVAPAGSIGRLSRSTPLSPAAANGARARSIALYASAKPSSPRPADATSAGNTVLTYCSTANKRRASSSHACHADDGTWPSRYAPTGTSGTAAYSACCALRIRSCYVETWSRTAAVHGATAD